MAQYFKTALFLLLFTACGPSEEVLIRQKVDARVAEFSKKRRQECRNGLMTEASKTVDSLLLAEAQTDLRDSLNRMRPFKPEQPPAVPPIDSLEVKPIFNPKKN